MAEICRKTPPLCGACGRSCRAQAVICNACARQLAAAEPLLGIGPPGLDRVWSSAPFEGVARDLVAALRFRRSVSAASLLADRIEWLAPRHMLSGTIVPVPAERRGSRRTRFEPIGELAAALAERLEAPLDRCLERRSPGPLTGGRRRHKSPGPPAIRATGAAPRSVILLDDVLERGATLTACARALRAAGASRVVAVTVVRRV